MLYMIISVFLFASGIIMSSLILMAAKPDKILQGLGLSPKTLNPVIISAIRYLFYLIAIIGLFLVCAAFVPEFFTIALSLLALEKLGAVFIQAASLKGVNLTIYKAVIYLDGLSALMAIIFLIILNIQ